MSAELSAGSALGQALRSFADRTAVEDIKPLAATLVQSEKLGAQIGPALRSISDTMRTTPAAPRRRSCRQNHRQDSLSPRALHPARDVDGDRGSGGDSNRAHAHEIVRTTAKAHW